MDDKRMYAQGMANVFMVGAEVLALPPTDGLVAQVREVAQAFNCKAFAADRCDAALVQRFSDRFAVPNSSLYVPLVENAIRQAHIDAEKVEYGCLQGIISDHVGACYRAVGFDAHLAISSNRASLKLYDDSLSTELRFAAQLYHAMSVSTDEASFVNDLELAQCFMGDHLQKWIGKAYTCLSRTENDFYARTVWLMAAATEVCGAKVSPAKF